jgi:geranylgeranylglycerol-phosphate geranylgeranyltransferase
MVPEKTFVLAALAFLATLGREIAKDIEDIQGDEGRYTLPMSVGTKKAGVVASLAMAAAVLLSPIPLLSELFSGLAATLYIIMIAVTDAIFIYCIFLLLKERINASAVIKIGMLMALLAFLIGGVL